MSMDFHTTKKIPRSFFPSKGGSKIACRDGTVLTLGPDDGTSVRSSFCLTDGDAYVRLYFRKGFLSFFNMKTPSYSRPAGRILMNRIRSLYRGKFTDR